MTVRRFWTAAVFTAAYLLTIPAANWLVAHNPHGWWVPPNLRAPAGVYMVGVALVLRDVARELAGRAVVAGAVVAGALVSYDLATPALAVASGAAFLLGEGLDMAVYEPLRRRGLVAAMLASNTVGLIADSLIFLLIAFGSLHYLPGQIIGKTVMTLAAIPAIAALDKARNRRAQAVTA